MFAKLIAKAMNWNKLRKEIAKGVAIWIVRAIDDHLERPYVFYLKLLDGMPPADATAEFARMYGEAWLKRPTFDLLEEYADKLDRDGDYLKVGVQTFRKELRKIEVD